IIARAAFLAVDGRSWSSTASGKVSHGGTPHPDPSGEHLIVADQLLRVRADEIKAFEARHKAAEP
ncbi:MAG TPA: hypothetical protein VFF82_08445, partial [Rhodocyclaceae bacterium]|nr:hypothetical protein [Rhodocyclaceae bacterium]